MPPQRQVDKPNFLNDELLKLNTYLSSSGLSMNLAYLVVSEMKHMMERLELIDEELQAIVKNINGE